MKRRKVSLGDYLPIYEKQFMALQSADYLPKLAWNYHGTTASTWEISFSQVEKEDTKAAELLLVCSYLKPDNISERLWNDEAPEGPQITGPIDPIPILLRRCTDIIEGVDRIILLLSSLSIVQILDSNGFSIHPVVHLWARERLKPAYRIAIIKKCIRLLARAASRVTMINGYSNWDFQEGPTILSHLKHLYQICKPQEWISIISESEAESTDGQLTFHFVQRIALLFQQRMMLHEATQLYRWIIEGQESKPSTDTNQLSVLETRYLMAGCLLLQEDDDSLNLFLQIYEDSKKLNGDSHPLTVRIIGDIGCYYHSSDQNRKAIDWFQKSIKAQGEPPEFDDFEILGFVLNLGKALLEVGRLEEAEVHVQTVVERFGSLIPENSFLYGRGTLAMGEVLERKGMHEESLVWQNRAFEIGRRLYGEEHPWTLDRINDVTRLLLLLSSMTKQYVGERNVSKVVKGCWEGIICELYRLPWKWVRLFFIAL